MLDRIALINLDKRQDRLGAFKAKISTIPELSGFYRYRAVHGDTVGVPGFYTAGGGAWGCRESHRQILSDALHDGVQTLMVLEDDVCFCPNFWAKFTDFVARVPDDWAGLMLGGQTHANPAPSPTGVAGILRTANTQRTHAYVVRGIEPMRDLYRLWSRCDTHIDHWFGQWQARHPVYQPDPFLCGQDEGPSDISGRRDSVRFWSAPATPPAHQPIVLLAADRKVADRLRALGLHWGHTRCPATGRDKGVIDIEAAGWPADRLGKWADLIVGEAVERGDVPCLWHNPMPVGRFLADRIGRPIRLVEATTVDEAVEKIEELKPAHAASKVVWCWRGRGNELLEGLAYHGFHRGYHRDEVTGMCQGIRRIVDQQVYAGVRPLVAQLRREAQDIRRGKVLLAHPDLDVAAVRACLWGETVEELDGADLGAVLEQAAVASSGRKA